jgi:hypothetical protein
MRFNPQSYGVFAALVAVDRRRPLDGGAPSGRSQPVLASLSLKTAFAHARGAVVDQEAARCCVAGVWLLYDELDESHAITQSIKSDDGSFWHAIMHRREGDFSNAKYWFRHVGEHPTFAALADCAANVAASHGQSERVTKLAPNGDWDPYAFVDLCQRAVREGGPLREFCLDVQQAEWELLFDHCYRVALDA